MMMVEMRAAQASMTQLLDRVEQGETIIIARDGVPVARLAPTTHAAEKTR
ncbi:MAG: type II toxin-antitoxin system prevent-host-death family antitoxin [Nocardioidaceae bacterium]|nr:type II toxin-antitoxin system prevent-host-death family antitoxin [Nocardioidaceae bacterium]